MLVYIIDPFLIKNLVENWQKLYDFREPANFDIRAET